MATVIRPEITEKSRWYLERHRYYELKHFCMQCPSWRKELQGLDGWKARRMDSVPGLNPGDPTAEEAVRRAFYSDRIGMLDEAARETDNVIGVYILEGIVSGKSYDALNACKRIPCCRDVYYELYRKFFYILSELRQ